MNTTITDPTPTDLPTIEDIWSHELGPGLTLDAGLVLGVWLLALWLDGQPLEWDWQGVAGSSAEN